MSNLTIVKSKNQIGIGTNQIQLTNSLSSALNIKKNDDSYSFLEFNTSSNTIGIGIKMETNALITFKGTTKVTSLSKGDLVYLDSTGNWTGVGPVGIGSYIKVNSGGTGLEWTNEAPLMLILSTSPLHTGTLSSNSDNIIITFDDIVVAGTGNIVLTPSSGPVITIDVTNTSLVSFSSNICTINPNSNLDSSGLTYTLTMNSGVIKNSNGVLFSGILSPTYQFNSKDTTTPIFTNLSPGTNTYINNTNIGYTLSESFASGTVTFTSTGGTTDSSSPHIQVLSGSELNAGTRNIGVLTDAPTLVSGTIYTIGFDGIDSLGNVFSTVSTTGITFDNTNPIISSIGPTSSSYVNTNVVSYTLSETLASGTVTFTRISGNADSNHTVSLASGELNSGSHNNTTLTNAPTLVNGTVYSIAFNGIDLAENSASQVSVTDITYDTTAPTVTNSIVSSNSTSTLAKAGDEVTLTITANEAISEPTVIFKSGNTSVTNSSITYSGSGTTWTAKYTVDTNDTDGNVTINVTATDLAGNSTTSTSITGSSITVDTTAPTVTNSIVSNNSTSTLAKAGDEVTLTITANEAISEPTVIFKSGNTSVTNSSITYSGSGTTWTAKYTVDTNDTDGNVTINVTATDLAGNSTTSTSITGSSITVDTLVPTVTSILISNNSTITITFNKIIYKTISGSGSIEANDFVLSLTGGNATLASTTPTSISPTSGNADEYTLGINISGTTNGSETLTISPSENSIYDLVGNVASTSQSNNSANLEVLRFESLINTYQTKNYIIKAGDIPARHIQVWNATSANAIHNTVATIPTQYISNTAGSGPGDTWHINTLDIVYTDNTNTTIDYILADIHSVEKNTFTMPNDIKLLNVDFNTGSPFTGLFNGSISNRVKLSPAKSSGNFIAEHFHIYNSDGNPLKHHNVWSGANIDPVGWDNSYNWNSPFNYANNLLAWSWNFFPNPYASTDIQHWMWNQNQQSGSETRGEVGYVQILAGPENSNGAGYDSGRLVAGYVARVHHGNKANGTTYVVRPDDGVGLSTWNPDGEAEDRKKWKILKLANGNYKITNVWQIAEGIGSTFAQGCLNWVSEWDVEYNSTYNGNNVYNLKVKVPVSSTYTNANTSHIGKYLTIGTNTERPNQNSVYDTYKFKYAYDILSARSDGYWFGQQWTFSFI